ETHPETVLLGGSHIEFFGLHLPTEPHLFSLLAVEEAREVSFQDLLERNCFSHSSVLFSRQALDRGFRYREAFLHSQDYDLWLRIALEGGVRKLLTPVCFYRRRLDAISLANTLEQLEFAERARILALERQATGIDSLERTGRLPEISPAVEAEIRRRTCNIFLHFAGLLFRRGRIPSGAILAMRSFSFAPLSSVRELLLLFLGDRAAAGLRARLGKGSSF
ncbi:MAG: hypothetical protein V1918_01295, partial [Planctomycetota bacterium]